MENPTPSNGRNRGGTVDVRDVIQYFGSFKLGNDGNFEASRTDNAAIPTPQEHAHSKKIKNLCDVVKEKTDKYLRLSEKSVLEYNEIQADEFYSTRGQVLWQNHEQGSFKGFQDYNGNYYVGVLEQERDSNPGFASTPNYFQSNPMFVEESSFSPRALYNYGNYELREARTNGVYSGPSCSSRPLTNQRGMETCTDAPVSLDLTLLKEILEGGDRGKIGMLLNTLRGSYIDLMTDKALSDVFLKLVDACRGQQLDYVVADLLSCPPLFVNAAFCKQGATSIIRLVKRLKKSSNALIMTQALSTQFVAIMNDEIARMVIQHCLICFPNHHNRILYEKAIHHYQELATHKVGCRALKELINTIAGEQRSRLLNEIADSSDHLAYNQYGNYVVQHVLSLKGDGVSGVIVSRLRGECVELAKQKGGSHVVQKCIEASDYGIASVVQEIVATPQGCLELAQNQFGNYVIQTALEKTKEHGFTDLHESLLRSLEPHIVELKRSMSGMIVLGLLKDKDSVKLKRAKGNSKITYLIRGECCNGMCNRVASQTPSDHRC